MLKINMPEYLKYRIAVMLIDKHVDAEDKDWVPARETASGDALISDNLRKIRQKLISFWAPFPKRLGCYYRPVRPVDICDLAKFHYRCINMDGRHARLDRIEFQ